MSVCAGKTKCEIYRQKKYCRKSANVDENNECVGCRHAKRQCDVGYCVFSVNGWCKALEERLSVTEPWNGRA